MKALIVTSRTTFVPDNYDDVILGLAARPEVHGLVELDNSGPVHLKTGLALVALGARGLGTQLLRNNYGLSRLRRRWAYRRAGKRVWTLPDLNGPEALALIASEGIDLIVNARTRCIYKKDILAAPRLGCVNVHHGLLPEQRGTMCDLWALHEGQAAGFSLHQMTPEIDAGQIFAAVRVSDAGEKDYMAYLRRGMQLELAAISRLLEGFAAQGSLPAMPNSRQALRPHQRNPKPAVIRQMLQQGMIL